MLTLSKKWGSAGLCVASALVAWIATAQAADPRTTDESDQRIVLRISEEYIDTLLQDKQVERVSEVRENILGTSIVGTAHVIAQPGVHLKPSGDEASFYLTLKGTVHTRSTGYNGPAIVKSRAVTQFTGTKMIVFEPGKGFKGRPAQVKATTRTYIDSIDSVQGGIVGRIVRRRAARQESAQHDQVQEIARQRAEARLQVAFDKNAELRLAKLNEATDFKALATILRATGNGEPNYACCTTAECLQVATHFGKCEGVMNLPNGDLANHERAPIEVWVHNSLITPSIAVGMEVMKTTANAASQNSQPPAKQPVSIEKMSDWRRVDVIATPAELVLLAALFTGDQPAEMRSKPVTNLPTPSTITSSTVTTKVPTHRIWTSGQFTAEASFVALEGQTVRLKRTSGVGTSIALEKLSPADQKWIRNHLAAN